MSSQLITKFNSFIKNRLIEFLGIFMLFASAFLLVCIITYSPSDPNFIYTPGSVEIKNLGGFYGSIISDFLLQALGLISILLIINIFYWGTKLITKKKISSFSIKIFFLTFYLIFGTTALDVLYRESFWLIDNGNGGFVGRIIKENIYYLTVFIENQYVAHGLIFFTLIFFVLSLGIKLNEILKIIFFPIEILKKIVVFFKKNKKAKFATDVLENEIEFMVTAQGSIVVLNVTTENPAIENYIKNRLNYKEAKVAVGKNKFFNLSYKIVKEI